MSRRFFIVGLLLTATLPVTLPIAAQQSGQAPREAERASPQDERASPQDERASPQDERASLEDERASPQDERAPLESEHAPVEGVRAPLEEDHAYVRILTNVQGAFVYADSTFIGRVSGDVVAVPAETSRIRLIVGDLQSWSIPPIEQKLRAEPGDTVDVQLRFDYHYRIESMPFGADVHLERDAERIYLGETPLLHTSAIPLDGTLAVERSGYVVERLLPGSDVWNRHVVALNPSSDLEVRVTNVDWRPPRKHTKWIDYAALGTALAAGALAVHYKFKADALYSEYEDTADPSLRPDIQAYDVRSGVAFGVMQAGIGVFAVRLFLR